VGGWPARFGTEAFRSLRPVARSPPTLALPHNGGRERAPESAVVWGLCKIIFSTHQGCTLGWVSSALQAGARGAGPDAGRGVISAG
jgi:hypothetical protein